MADIEKLSKQPLLLLPTDWRPTMMKFFMRWSHLNPDPSQAICVRVHECRNEGMTLEELIRVIENLNRSTVTHPVSFSIELSNRFDGIAGQVLRLKKITQRNLSDRQAIASATVGIITGLAERFRSPISEKREDK